MFQDCVLSLALLFFSEFIVDWSTDRTGQVISCVLNTKVFKVTWMANYRLSVILSSFHLSKVLELLIQMYTKNSDFKNGLLFIGVNLDSNGFSSQDVELEFEWEC